MQSTIHTKVRWSSNQNRYICYFYVTESSGRSYGADVFFTSMDVKQAMRKAQEVAAQRRLNCIPYVW